jgi:DNA-directed RNA polymerase specialized sigma24 family protein
VDASRQVEVREFVAARGAALFRVAHGLTGSQHAAEDLLQAALERAVTRWRHIDDPEAYVRRVLYNEYTSWQRRAARRPERLMAAPPDRAAAGDESAAADLRGDERRDRPVAAAATGRAGAALPRRRQRERRRAAARLFALHRQQPAGQGAGPAAGDLPGHDEGHRGAGRCVGAD